MKRKLRVKKIGSSHYVLIHTCYLPLGMKYRRVEHYQSRVIASSLLYRIVDYWRFLYAKPSKFTQHVIMTDDNDVPGKQYNAMLCRYQTWNSKKVCKIGVSRHVPVQRILGRGRR